MQAISITSDRLTLQPLTLEQLRAYLDGVQDTSGPDISRRILTDQLRRAIGMKIERMAEAEDEDHLWLTYWLMVVKQDRFGAGMAGFKGAPNKAGEVEIGYGIDPAYQAKGYTTEAVSALIAWAFKDPRCRSVIAPDTARGNVASHRVLQKVGMHVYEQSEAALSWRIDRVG